jgi:hypothetical protein
MQALTPRRGHGLRQGVSGGHGVAL